MSSKIKFSLLGNPNCGKTAIFNLLTGLNQKVANHPGITVEKKISEIHFNSKEKIEIEDFPGTYSIIPQSLDEQIVSSTILKWEKNPHTKPDGIIYVSDITNLRQNMFFLTQLLPLDIPIILLLNMVDLIKKNIINTDLLEKNIGIHKIIPFSATKHIGLNTLKKAMISIKEKNNRQHAYLQFPDDYRKMLLPLKEKIMDLFSLSNTASETLALSLLCNNKQIEYFDLEKKDLKNISLIKKNIINNFNKNMDPHISSKESNLRYAFIDEILSNCQFSEKNNINKISKSEKIDKIFTHTFWGPIIYIGILYIIFQSIFTWATIPMDFIDSMINNFGNYVSSIIPKGIFQDLIVNGIIAGVGAIIIFLPQILLLMLFMTILEDSGYMTRIAFIMDKYMKKIGLDGKSISPIMSGYACAIPGIISARTISGWKERLITILIIPLISCSARLPIYVLMIGAFIPNIYFFNLISLQGLVMVLMYFLGTITAFILAKIFSRYLSEKSSTTFILEFPPYRLPIIKSVFQQVYIRGKQFITDAGKIIMLISIILWFLASFPKDDQNNYSINNSYAGKIGQFIEPVIQPLGFDWKIGIGLIASFAAREVVVSTLSTIYNIKDNEDGMVNLKEAMKNDVNPSTGKHVYTPLVAISLMVFYVYSAQCMATFAIVKTETNTWKWPIFMIIYMTLLAYCMSFAIYQGGQLLGFS
ncbi:MAG: ferrous iron transport protein B [Candidatus Neomarinimicrobiota bacterium]|nr:ferrous iron transport protein B [Candidatus Neomarinimicrobiota bacterium]